MMKESRRDEYFVCPMCKFPQEKSKLGFTPFFCKCGLRYIKTLSGKILLEPDDEVHNE